MAKKWVFTIFALISLGLGACSVVAVRDQPSVASGSLSQANDTKLTGGVKTNVSDLSSFFDITYFDYDSAELGATDPQGFRQGSR